MTGKTSAATLGLIGGLALGVWAGTELTHERVSPPPEPAAITSQAPQEAAAPAAPANTRRVTRAPRATSTGAAGTSSSDAPTLVMTIPVSAPELHERIKPVLARGTKIPLAVEGFTDAQQFATLAHAARNTHVPFILLKHRVLREGLSLEDAIRASNTDVDAHTEALRAMGEARADILAVSAIANNVN